MLQHEMLLAEWAGGSSGGAQFTCFTGIKVQILTQLSCGQRLGRLQSIGRKPCITWCGRYCVLGTQFTTQFTCFTSTKVQILTPKGLGASASENFPPLATLVAHACLGAQPEETLTDADAEGEWQGCGLGGVAALPVLVSNLPERGGRCNTFTYADVC
jgi:hypothetical protein